MLAMSGELENLESLTLGVFALQVLRCPIRLVYVQGSDK
jgi:hypothetical protein